MLEILEAIILIVVYYVVLIKSYLYITSEENAQIYWTKATKENEERKEENSSPQGNS
jgi:Ca2+/Na+ antiporter